MAADSVIAQFVGYLLAALLAGSWTPLPADRIAPDLPAPVVFAAEWKPPVAVGDRVDQVLILADGSVRPGGISALVSHRRSDDGCPRVPGPAPSGGPCLAVP